MLLFYCRDTPSQLNDLLSRRQVLDRRRLEEGFLLFAGLEVINSYGLVIEHVPCNRNELAEMVSGKFRDAFVQKWGGKYQKCQLYFLSFKFKAGIFYRSHST